MLFRDDLKAIADKARSKVFEACPRHADIIVSTDPTHVGYLSGYRSVLLDADRTYRCAVIVTRNQTMLITGASDAAPALEVLRDPACIYRYGLFYVSSSGRGADLAAMPKAESTFPDALRSAMRTAVKASHMIGLDCASESDFQELSRLAGENAFDARAAVIKARSTKLPEEIEKMRYAAELTERGMEKALGYAKSGVTELDLSTIISTEIIAGGAIPRFVVVTAGDRSALADAHATRSKLKNGDILRLDVGCTFEGYWADTARTAIVGTPAREQQLRYDALLQGELAQLASARPGASAADLYNVAMQGVRKGALPNYQRSHCGHGLGITAHEFPTLNPANQEVELQEGMVLCVETPYYELGWGGMMVEDIIVIRKGGHECLTKLPRELRSV